jgi:TorA maturation chaperone TorD
MVDARMTEMAETAAARANIYGLLTAVFRAEPSSSFLTRLKDPEMLGVFEALGISLGEDFHDSPNEQLREDLAVEFTRLFLGPGGHISPHESLHTDKASAGNADLWGSETVEVKRFMEAAGLTVDDSFTGMPDHICAELEFMQRLATKEAEAWAEPNEEFATNILKIEQRFLDEHLSRWASRFSEKVIEMSEHPFYLRFAEMMKGFLEFETRNVQAFIAQAGNAKVAPVN